MPHIGLAQVPYERDELDAAGEYAAVGVVIQVLATLAHASRGEAPAARAALADALAGAAPEGYLQVFVDEGEPLAAVLRELLVRRRREQLTGPGTASRSSSPG